ncbi:CgeB family protein [Bacillus mesophilum]|uniref:CgeB family protein n=1 Tax=Bacillus mesophilum TaxID=1071718 RepID=UPI00137618F8|nr:glycosyltransferase [Bacillus mesophilum]
MDNEQKGEIIIKVLFIASGYPAIYKYIESSILSALKERQDTETISIQPTQPLEEVKEAYILFKPDLILTVLGDLLDEEKRKWIASQSIPSALWLTEDPFYTNRSINILTFFKYIFTINRASAGYYKTLGYQHVDYLPLGTNPDIYIPQPHEKKVDVCLIGYPYEERIKYVNLILKETEIRVLVAGNLWRKSLIHQQKQKQLIIIDKWVPPKRAGIIYQSAKICLNTIRSNLHPSNQNLAGIQNDSVNNRTFDIAALSSFQLVQHTNDLATHFDLGTEISSFHSETDLLNMLDFYLLKENLRQEIAVNARNKVLNVHTFSHRLERIFSIIFD